MSKQWPFPRFQPLSVERHLSPTLELFEHGGMSITPLGTTEKAIHGNGVQYLSCAGSVERSTIDPLDLRLEAGQNVLHMLYRSVWMAKQDIPTCNLGCTHLLIVNSYCVLPVQLD